MAELKLELDQSLEQRIAQFKKDPEKMKDVNDFLNELLQSAVVEAEIKSNAKQKGRLDMLGFQNGGKRIGAWQNRARVFANRVFTAICNCTNSVRNVTLNRS